MKSILLFIILVPFVALSQVGINTTTPQATLDVNGSLRVANVPSSNAAKVIGTDVNGTVSQVNIGDNLQLTSGTLHSNGSTKYFVATKSTPTLFSGFPFHNVDLELTTTNKDIVVFRLSGSSHNYEFTGVSGGTDGKHIILLNVSANNFKVSDESPLSLPQNRIITMAGGFEQTSGAGLVELVYDGTINRWIVLNFRN